MDASLKEALRQLQSLEFVWPFQQEIDDEVSHVEEDGELDADDKYFKAVIAYMEAYSTLHETIHALQSAGRQGKLQVNEALEKANLKLAEMKALAQTLCARVATVIKFHEHYNFKYDFSKYYLLDIRVQDAIHDAEYSIADLRSPKPEAVKPYVDLAISYLARAKAAPDERALGFAQEAKKIAERKLAVLKRKSAEKTSTTVKPQERAKKAVSLLSQKRSVPFNMEEVKAEDHSGDLEDVLELNALLAFVMQDLRDEQDSVEAEVAFAQKVLEEKHKSIFEAVRAAEDCLDSLTMKIDALDRNHNKAFSLLRQMLGAIERFKVDRKFDSESEGDPDDDDDDDEDSEDKPEERENSDDDYEDGGYVDTDADESEHSGDEEVAAQEVAPVRRNHLPDATEAMQKSTHEEMMMTLFPELRRRR